MENQIRTNYKVLRGHIRESPALKAQIIDAMQYILTTS